MNTGRFKKAVLGTLGGSAALVLCLVLLDMAFPLPRTAPEPACVVTAKDHTPLRAFADKDGIWRYPVSINAVSKTYIQALLTYEDRWFYYHPGVNPFAIFRALFQNIRAKKTVSGGSTLTMQVARLLFPHPRSVPGKIRQMLRALQLEWHLSKDQILTLYLNMAPFGSNIEGVQAAAYTWLGKPADMLSHAEAALLAVLPQAPSRYRPDRHPDRAKKARDKVLDRMAAFRAWPEEDIRSARIEPVVSFRNQPPVTAPLLARRLHRRMPDHQLIRSCIDFDLQLHLETLIRDYCSRLPDQQSAAALVVDIPSAEVLAYAGSADFGDSERQGHVDMVRAIRSPGSTLKPFLYGFCLDQGLIHSHSLLVDTPRFKQAYDPGNFSKGFLGPVSAAKALRMSLNVPAVQLLEAYGPQTFSDRLKNAGARVSLHGAPNLSMILGGMGSDLESIVTLFTAIAADGITTGLKFTVQDLPQRRFLMSPGAAWILREILSQPLPGFEHISRLSPRVPVAWKTGTSYGFRDAWAVGIMGNYVAGVWIGRPDGSPCPGQYGARTAVPLLERILFALPLSSFKTPPPKSVSKTGICWPLGHASDRFPEHCHMTRQAWVLDHVIPPTLPTGLSMDSSLLKSVWVDQAGRRARPSCGGKEKKTIALWPKSLDPWLPNYWRRHRLIPEASPQCPDMAAIEGNRLEITGIQDRGVLTRTPGQQSPPALPLTSIGGNGKQHWFLNQQPVGIIMTGTSGTCPMPLPGAYQLAVLDESGNSDFIEFEVIEQAGSGLE